MSVYHSLLYVAFLISVAQCQTTLTQAEIAKILQMIQNQPGGQASAQNNNNADTVRLIQKLMASSQGGNQVPQTNFRPQQPQQPQAPMQPQPATTPLPPPNSNNLLLPLAITGVIDNPLTALAATSMTGGNQRNGGANLNGYLTARAFDFNDFATNMMLFNGLNGQQSQPQTPQQQSAGNQPTPTPQTQPSNGGLFGHSPMGNYITARAFDFPDMYTNMMLYNGVSGRQQPGSQQQMPKNQAQSTFDPTLLYLSAF